MGFSIAMPVGPIGLLCIRNSLALGLWGGILSGLGAACVDSLFGCLAGLGISAFNLFLEEHSMLFHLIGAFILSGIGIGILIDTSRLDENENSAHLALKGLSYAFFSTFFLTLINPLTILSYAAIYAAIASDVAKAPGVSSALTVALGVFIGSLLWWIILSVITVSLKKKMESKHKRWINTISGSFIIILGLGTLLATLF